MKKAPFPAAEAAFSFYSTFAHPASNLILNGITRRTLLELFRKNGWQHEEKAITKDELMNADEVFIFV